MTKTTKAGKSELSNSERSPIVEELERRVLYSADSALLPVDLDQDRTSLSANVELLPPDTGESAESVSSVAVRDSGLHLVLIDSSLTDSDVLGSAVDEDATILIYDSSDSAENLLAQVSKIADSHGEKISSLSILSHGSEGRFDLGNEFVSADMSEEQRAAWSSLSGHFASGANIYLYGCNVGGGEGDGQALLDTLATLTQADVFASDDVTGAGGDWVLEVASAGDEAELGADAFDHLDAQALASYRGTLAVDTVRDEFTNPNYSGNEGTVNWTGDWVEWTESDGPGAGTLRVDSGNPGMTGNSLQIDLDVNGRAIYREVDLSNAADATLTFYYTQNDNILTSGWVDLSVSGDGGASWTVLQSYDVDSDINTRQFQSFDISGYLASNTMIAFTVTNTSSNSFYVDDVEISYTLAGPVVSGTLGGSYTEGDSPASIVDAAVTVSDPNGSGLSTLTVAIDNLLDGSDESLAANTSGTSIVANYDSGTGALTLTGPASAADFQQVARTITYHNTSDDPNETPRTISFVVNDGTGDGVTQNGSVTVNGVDDPAVADAGLDQSVNPLDPVTLNGSASSDPDGPSLDYSWVQTGGPAVTLSDPTAVSPTFTAPNPSVDTDLTFELTVSNNPAWEYEVESRAPVSHWNLGEDSGSTFSDPVNGHDGTAQGGLTLGGTGFNGTGQAPVFDGSSSYIEIAHDDDFLLDEGSIQLWFKPDTVSGEQALFSKDSTNFDTGGHLTVWRSGDEIRVRLQSLTVTNVNITSSGVDLVAGQWHHLTLTFGSGGLAAYVDGNVAITDPYTGGLGTSSGGAGNFEPLVIGADATVSDDLLATPLNSFFAGQIDEVAIFGTQLNATDVNDLYTAGQTGGQSSTDSVTITVDVGNLAAPVADAGGPYAINEGDSLVLDASGSSDLDPGALTYAWDLDNDGVFGEVGEPTTVGPNIDWTTLEGFGINDEGTYTIGVEVTDVGGLVDTSTANVVVTNTAPTANDDTNAGFTTNQDTAFTTANVLSNDSDSAAGDVLSVSSINITGTLGLVTDNGNGTFDYDPNGQFDGLSAAQQATDTFTYTLSDGDGGFDTATVTITINGISDPPVISGVSSGSVTEDSGLDATGTLTATDVDDADGFQVNAALAGAYGTGTVDAAGNWTYTLNDANAVVDALNSGDVLMDTITVLTTDGTSQDIDITINGADDAPLVSGAASGSVTEDSGLDATGTLTATDVDDADGFQVNAALAGAYGTGTVDAAGNWTYTLNDGNAVVDALNSGDVLMDTITVLTTDGTSQDIDITINGADDAPLVSGSASGSVTEDSGLDATGTLTATDVDDADGFQVNAALAGAYGTGTVDAAGNWTYTLNDGNAVVDALNSGDVLMDTITVLTTDGTSQDIDITINGADDAPLVSGSASGSVTEDSGLDATGTLTATDVDDADGFQVNAALAGAYGTGTVDAAGNWTYTLNDANAVVDALNSGDVLMDTITVLTTDGTSQDIDITINGADDAPLVSGSASGSVTEDSGLDATGTLTATDVDDADGFQVNAALAGAYGTGTVDAAGNWTYTLNDANAVVDALNSGDVLMDTITVLTTDGTSQDIDITINGADDAPLIDLDQNDSTTTGDGYTATHMESAGPVAIVDVDAVLSDVDDVTVDSIVVTIASFPDGVAEILSADTTGTALTAFYDDAVGVLLIDGVGTRADFEQVLRTVTYDNTSLNPTGAARTVTFVASDGSLDSNVATAAISLVPFDDSPTLDLDPDDGTASGIDFAATFVEDGGSVAIADSDAALGDVDSANLASLTVVITNLQDGLLESLSVNTAGTPLAASYDGSLGTLLISGPGTPAEYEQVLRTVRYDNASQSPTAGNRTITFVASDGTTSSGMATSNVDVQGQNDQPTMLDLNLNLDENSAFGSVLTGLTPSDPDVGDAHTFAITAGNSSGAFGIDVSTGTISVANSAILDHETNPTLIFTVEARDAGGLAGAAQVTVQIADVNEAPVANLPGAQSTAESTPMFFSTAGANTIAIAEGDQGDPTVEVTLTANRGAVTLGSNPGLSILVGDGTDDSVMTFRGSLSDVNTALDGLRFSPDPNFAGTASLQVDVDDLGGATAGAPLTDSGTISIEAVAAATPPTVIIDTDVDPGDSGDPPQPSDEDTGDDGSSDADDESDEAQEAATTDPVGAAAADSSLSNGEGGYFDPSDLVDSMRGRLNTMVTAASLAEEAAYSILQPELSVSDFELAEVEELEGEVIEDRNRGHRESVSWLARENFANDMLSDAEQFEDQTALAALSMEGAGLVLSAGALTILARGSSLLAMALSSLPVWARVDPLSVLALSESERERHLERQRDIEGQEDRINKGLGELLGGPAGTADTAPGPGSPANSSPDTEADADAETETETDRKDEDEGRLASEDDKLTR